jgi:hypothetical protein
MNPNVQTHTSSVLTVTACQSYCVVTESLTAPTTRTRLTARRVQASTAVVAPRFVFIQTTCATVSLTARIWTMS